MELPPSVPSPGVVPDDAADEVGWHSSGAPRRLSDGLDLGVGHVATGRRPSRFRDTLDGDGLLNAMLGMASPQDQDTCSSGELKGRPFSDQVDVLEIALGIAFRDHRYRVEEVLEEHMEAMELAEAAHRLELSRLRAENAILRERLGLGAAAPGPELFQTVALQAAGAAAAAPEKGGPGGKVGTASTGLPARKAKPAAADLDDGNEVDMRRRSHKDQKQVPTGAWQQFVAWVPAGSGLQAPQPWQPLPPETVAPPPPEAQKGLKQRSKGEIKGEMTGVLSAWGSNANSTEDSSSEGSGEKQVKFEVVDAFRASLEELQASRHSLHARELQRKEDRKTGRSFNANGVTRVGSDEHEDACGLPEDTEEERFFTEQKRDWWIIHPHSVPRIAWDVSSLTLVVYDMITIPLSLFNMPENFFLYFMEWTTRLFWTFDMGMSACTGVTLKDGSVQLEFVFILKRYLKTWFALDTFIVASTWMELIANGAGGAGSFGRLSRAFRIVRVVRLLRLVRMKEVMAQITERVQSDTLAFVVNIVKLVIFIISVAHVTACVWWGIGDRATDGPTWVEKAGFLHQELDSQYLMSLHWALSQFTGGMDEVTPATAVERLYAVIMWIFAFVTAAVCVSVLTSSLTQLHIIGGSRSRQVATLRKFLKQNAISSNLALRMQRSAQHALSADLTADVVELLPVVSEPLRVEMHFEMYTHDLRSHGFFGDYIAECPQVIRRVCHYAMSTLLLSNCDVVFSKGETPAEPKMYFVCKGSLEYSQAGETTAVAEHKCAAEAALWTRWTHQGTLTAASDVKLAVLDAKTFQEIADRFKDTNTFDPKLYAAEFVAHLNSVENVSDLTSCKYKGSQPAGGGS